MILDVIRVNLPCFKFKLNGYYKFTIFVYDNSLEWEEIWEEALRKSGIKH